MSGDGDTPSSDTPSSDTPNSDAIWKALSSPYRRTLLKALRDGPKTTSELVDQLPSMTRFAVMKHISVLRDVGLVISRDQGPRKMNRLNAIPLRQVYEELTDDFQDLWAHRLLRVKRRAESSDQDETTESDRTTSDRTTTDARG